MFVTAPRSRTFALSFGGVVLASGLYIEIATTTMLDLIKDACSVSDNDVAGRTRLDQR